MRVLIHGSELAAATAAAALASVGHHVSWWLHAETPWETLAHAGWLRREPRLLAQLEESRETGSLTLLDELAGCPLADQEVVWLAVSPGQRSDLGELLEALAAGHPGGLVLVNNSTFPVGETERLEGQLSGRGHSVALPDLLEEGRAWDTFTRPSRWLLGCDEPDAEARVRDRKSTRLNSSHVRISYAVFCLKKKNGRHDNALNLPK